MDLQPLCAQSCLSSAITGIGCPLRDTGCACGASAQDAIGSAVAPCLLANCPATELVEIGNAGKAACSAYSITHIYSNALSTPTATGGTASTAKTNQASIPTNTGTSVPISQTRRLSTGAIIGIAVGGFAVLVVFALAFFLCVRKRKAHMQPKQQSALRSQDSFSEMQQLFPSPSPSPSPSQQAQELQTRANNHELSSREHVSSRQHQYRELAMEQQRRSLYELHSESAAPVQKLGVQRVQGASVIITPPTPISPKVFRPPSLLGIMKPVSEDESEDGGEDEGENLSVSGSGSRSGDRVPSPEKRLLLMSKSEGRGASFRERVQARRGIGRGSGEVEDRVQRLMRGRDIGGVEVETSKVERSRAQILKRERESESERGGESGLRYLEGEWKIERRGGDDR